MVRPSQAIAFCGALSLIGFAGAASAAVPAASLRSAPIPSAMPVQNVRYICNFIGQCYETGEGYGGYRYRDDDDDRPRPYYRPYRRYHDDDEDE